MRFLTRVMLACGIIGLAASGARAACTVEPRATVPLEVIGGTILVPVLVNQIAATFILDTGATRSVVTRDAVARLALDRDPWVGTTMRGVGGVERLPNANPRSISLGGVPLARQTRTRDTSLTVGTLPNTKAADRVIDGLLGRDFLALFDLALDLPRRQVTLFSVQGCAGRFLPWPEPYAALAVENPADSALIVAVTLNGVRLRALLDTGASASLLAAPGMTRLGLAPAALAADPVQTVSGLGPHTVSLHRHRFDTLRIGAETTDHPTFWVGPVRLSPIADMLLGADWFAGKRVWISFTTKQVFVAG